MIDELQKYLINFFLAALASITAYFSLKSKYKKEDKEHNYAHGVISTTLDSHEKRITEIDNATKQLLHSIDNKLTSIDNYIRKEN